MENPLAKRFISFIIFGMGIGLSFWLKSVHETGGEIDERAIIFTPLLLLYGLVGMVYPDVMIGRGQFTRAPLGLKIFSILLALVGVGLGLWMRFVVFQSWTDKH